jgi:hypothetical protein
MCVHVHMSACADARVMRECMVCTVQGSVCTCAAAALVTAAVAVAAHTQQTAVVIATLIVVVGRQ